MPHLGLSLKRKQNFRRLHFMIVIILVVYTMYASWYMMGATILSRRQLRDTKKDRKRNRFANICRLIKESDDVCKSELRMDRRTFFILCEMLRDIGGLQATRNMSLEEIVSIFLYVLSHHQKNRTMCTYFIRSGESVSRHFNRCLKAVLKLHDELLKKPTPITDDCTDDRWKCFKNCLGALDGTYINVKAPVEERSRYRTRKGNIAMNVLGVCSPDMQFIYVLPGWEGSAHDGRVLRDAISRPNGLKIPQGCYYLVDAGYTNGEGFLAPYRGQRYHLDEWRGDRQPQTAEEYFNMKHSRARNVIERCFGVLKGKWSILRSCSYYPIKTQGRIILACCLLHNLIRRYMPTDIEVLYEEEDIDDDDDSESEMECITTIQTSNHWSNFRNSHAQQIFNNWRVNFSRANSML
ncbi:protein ALP1-like [Mercurialis annua]|uniref:protein ALP1-like n=1 Tax=Mercurialis annua TaxID=3986 RepID=UPI00215E8DDF|nr:protein ALP1-like [Mercurialis annua]